MEEEDEDKPAFCCSIRINGCKNDRHMSIFRKARKEHLFMFVNDLHDKDGWLAQDNEISFEFSTISGSKTSKDCFPDLIVTFMTAFGM
ncbi:unnamed protein product [Cochlearia groenlandica]